MKVGHPRSVIAVENYLQQGDADQQLRQVFEGATLPQVEPEISIVQPPQR
jgi:hypothetical protein